MTTATKDSIHIMTRINELISISTPSDASEERKSLEFRSLLNAILQETKGLTEKDLDPEQWIELADEVLIRLYKVISLGKSGISDPDDGDGKRHMDKDAILHVMRDVIQEKLQERGEPVVPQGESMSTNLPLSNNAIKVLKKRYLKKGPDGESPERTCSTVLQRISLKPSVSMARAMKKWPGWQRNFTAP